MHVEIVPMEATLLCVLLCLLWSLVEVQSVTEYPHIYFRGNILPNHSYVDSSEMKENIYLNRTLQCRTDLETCCRSQSNGIPGRGDWFTPGSDTRLPFGSETRYGIYEDRQSQVVHLRRRNYVINRPFGIYRCVIPTNAVHDDNDPSVGETVYVGIYDKEGGI